MVAAKKKVHVRSNGRSTDFIAPSFSNGCVSSCSYCYVARHKRFSNPVTLFVNTDEHFEVLDKHIAELGPKKTPNQTHPTLWTYDIGENSDVSIDARLSTIPQTVVEYFGTKETAMCSFATKTVNKDLLSYNHNGRARIRFSIMPQKVSRVVDVNTDKVSERIKAINDFVDAGWEVHINISPVIVYHGWTSDYRALFEELRDTVHDRAYKQLKSEIIFLTHNKDLHEINMQWHPQAEEKYLWKPQWQQDKVSENGCTNIRYHYQKKRVMIDRLRAVYRETIPEIPIRYCF